MTLSRDEFEKFVARAVERLPLHIQKKIKNVAFVVESVPHERILKKMGVRRERALLGLYEGIPQTAWGKDLNFRFPDKITLFKSAIERYAETREELEELIAHTVWHEIGHYFGFGEKEIRALERKWKMRNGKKESAFSVK